MKPKSTSEHDAAAPDHNDENAPDGVSRRGFLRGLGTSLAATALTGGVLAARPGENEAHAAAAPGDPAVVSGHAPVSLTVNGKKMSANVDPRRTLPVSYTHLTLPTKRIV